MRKSIFLVFLCVGCAVAKYQPPPVEVLLNGTEGIAAMPAFQRVLRTPEETPESEKAKVEYLLARMSKSPHKFIRNNMKYTGARGAIHLRWKYRKYIKEAPTVESFIERIARGSRTTGERYYIKIGNKVYFCSDIFYNELHNLYALMNSTPNSSGPGGMEQR